MTRAHALVWQLDDGVVVGGQVGGAAAHLDVLLLGRAARRLARRLQHVLARLLQRQ